jgi:hypothetical protein
MTFLFLRRKDATVLHGNPTSSYLWRNVIPQLLLTFDPGAIMTPWTIRLIGATARWGASAS